MSAPDAGGVAAPLPALVIVTGAPGSGKSTLARRLAADLRLPLLMRDEFKETLYDTVCGGQQPDAARSAELGQAAYALLYRLANRLLDARVGALLESNFYRRLSEPDLAPLAARTRAVQIHCGGDAATIVRRYQERAERGERHPGHNDQAVVPRLRAYLATDRCDPLDLAIPTLRVTTTGVAPYAPAYPAILAFARAGVREAPNGE